MPVPVVTVTAPPGDSANRANPSWTLPALAAGNLCLVAVGAGVNGAITAATLGFTKVEGITFSTNSMLEVWGKDCDGSESGQVITFSIGNSRPYAAVIFKITGGVTLANLIHDKSTTSTGSAPAGVSVNTITPNALVLEIIRAGTAAASPMTQPTGFTKTSEVTNSGGTNPGTLTSAKKTQASAGATGTDAWASSATTAYTKITIAISDGTANAPPTAVAGPHQRVAPGDLVTLAGSGTDADGTIASYSWSKAAGGGGSPADITLSSATAQNPTFTAPATDGVYIFSLTVTDDDGAPSTNIAYTAVSVDAALHAGVYPRVAGAWNPTGVLSVRRAGVWDTVTV